MRSARLASKAPPANPSVTEGNGTPLSTRTMPAVARRMAETITTAAATKTNPSIPTITPCSPPEARALLPAT